MVFPALICGIVGGFFSAAPGIGFLNCIFCMWGGLAGGLAVYLMKSINHIEGKISLERAFFTGGLAGLVTGVTAWILTWVGFPNFRFVLEMVLFLEFPSSLGKGLMLGIIAAGSTFLFILFAAIGGIVANEITK